ncbi:hypothetical protein NP493_466g01054 [Ridgeia piscesae]|uniref:Myosin motor domain-containing protein n=1 Tax=Ridgeia piscesae TaxID=27915 RepID=A0AAD9NUJ1_RIDPI|nr:hypothetical protein NP493_466g01054 [Ridgeia piscesae]
MSSGVGMVDNLATLSTLDEHSLVEELRARYSRGIIYTYIGDILIAFNPYAPLPIYDSAHLFKYTDVKIQSDVPPHIFAIADRAYQNMRRTSTSQCCIVSGESGAGKTESTKFLVQQIAHLCNYSSGNLQEKILQVNPLLEAFGNAVTVMNNNSSRFGKYIELKFDPEGNLLGVHIFEYLLESTRVLSHGEGESNFHMFYYMFAGLYEKQLKDNLLNSPDDHR